MGSIPLERIRKFHALTESPSPHEAAVARMRRDELLHMYGLTVNDLVEESTEVVGGLEQAADGNQRVELARQVAKSRRCRHMLGRSGAVAFKGYPEAAKDARQLFTALVGIVERDCELPPVGPYYTDNDFLAWRTCYWLGYVAAIQKQLDPEYASLPAEALSTMIANGVAPRIIVRIGEGLLREHTPKEADELRQLAYTAGQALGRAVPVPPYRGAAK